MYNEALNTQRALGISLIVLASLLFTAIVIIVAYMVYEDRKHRKPENQGRHARTQDLPLPKLDPAATTFDIYGSETTGKHRALETETQDKPSSDVADTRWDLPAIGAHIPEEMLQYDGPYTRLTFVKASADDPGYFNKIEDMFNGIR